MRFRIRIRIKGPTKWLARAAAVAGRSLTHAVASGIKSAGELASKVPVVGSPLHSVLSIAAGPFAAVDAVVHGTRIDRAVLTAVKSEIAAVKDLAPYAKLVITSIPGIGQGVGAALAMGTALVNGQPITEAVVAGVKGALPGGVIGQAVFEYTQKVVSGENVLKAGLNTGIAQLPGPAKEGLDLVARAAKGENIPKLALEKARASLPPEYRTALDTGIAIGQGKKLQNVVAEGVEKIGKAELSKMAAQGNKTIQNVPLFKETATLVKGAQESTGYQVGVAVLGYAGVNEQSVTDIRAKLTKKAQVGFDMAVSARIGKVLSRPAPAGLSLIAKAGFYTTKGMQGGGPKMNKAQMKLIAANKEARKGAMVAIKEMPKKGWWQKVKEFVGVG